MNTIKLEVGNHGNEYRDYSMISAVCEAVDKLNIGEWTNIDFTETFGASIERVRMYLSKICASKGMKVVTRKNGDGCLMVHRFE